MHRTRVILLVGLSIVVAALMGCPQAPPPYDEWFPASVPPEAGDTEFTMSCGSTDMYTASSAFRFLGPGEEPTTECSGECTFDDFEYSCDHLGAAWSCTFECTVVDQWDTYCTTTAAITYGCPPGHDGIPYCGGNPLVPGSIKPGPYCRPVK